MSKIIYTEDNKTFHEVRCDKCIFSTEIQIKKYQESDTVYLHCKIKDLTFGKDVIVFQKNRFREFTWKIHLIEPESIVVRPDFGCTGFKPKNR